MKLLLIIAFFAFVNTAKAQLPNEKFGKPSSMEWEYNGWGEAINADAIILCKKMKVTYQISDQVANFNKNSSEISSDNISDFGKNQIDDGNILVKYEFRLRTKILKQEGARHADIDIIYFYSDNSKIFDELTDLKVRVFSKNEKGKVETRKVNTASFIKERLDDNYMVVHVVVPDVQAGSIIEYQYNIISPRAAFLYDWVFQECIPTVRSKCDIEIPAFLQFKMNAPINKLIKASVEAGRMTYDMNRTDMKKAQTCITNHYVIIGDYILPRGCVLKRNQNDADSSNDTQEEIAVFTSQIANPGITVPAAIPQGHTHLRVK
jgi:hypothetical protein